MERNRQKDIEVYRQHVFEDSSICTTYELLLRFVAKLRSDLPKKTNQYRVGNLSPGYMDYTYFAFYDLEKLADSILGKYFRNRKNLSFLG